MDEIHITSQRDSWKTRPDLVADLGTAFKWNIDACASRPNVYEQFYGPEDDGHFH